MKSVKKLLLQLFMVMGLMVAPWAYADSIKTADQMLEVLKAQVSNISTNDLKAMVDNNPDLVLVDIRTPTEIQSMGGAIKAAQNTNIPRGWLEFRVPKTAEAADTPIVVYCGANYRSPFAAKTLMDMGYTNVKNYADGYLGWKKAGLPIE